MKISYLFVLVICACIMTIGCKSNKNYTGVESADIITDQSKAVDQSISESVELKSEEGDYINLEVSGKSNENYSIRLYRNSFAKFNGQHNSSVFGKHTGNTSAELLESIFNLVDSIELEDLDTDMTGGMGGAIYMLEFNLNEESKKLAYKQAGRLGLQKLQTEIVKAKNSISWNK